MVLSARSIDDDRGCFGLFTSFSLAIPNQTIHTVDLSLYDFIYLRFFFDKKALITSLIPSIDSSTDSSIFTVYYLRGGKIFMLIKHREREGEKCGKRSLDWNFNNEYYDDHIVTRQLSTQLKTMILNDKMRNIISFLSNLLNGHVPPDIFDR